MSELLLSWARSEEQYCDFCGSKMDLGANQIYTCPGCNNARQLALVLWIRQQVKRAS